MTALGRRIFPASRSRDPLTPRDERSYDEGAGRALLRGADVGHSIGAEAATGYVFGAPALIPHVERILDAARDAGDERLEQLAERFLRRARG